MLTDAEHRVWVQYMLSSDDFGVMRMSALTLQADNDALAKRPVKTLEKQLRELVIVNLLHTFEHQRRLYLYQRDWQDWQKITYPRRSLEPKPPVATCSRHTQWLLSHWPGGRPLSSWKAPEVFTGAQLDDLGNVSQIFPKDFSEPVAVSQVPEPFAGSRVPAAAAPPDPEIFLDEWFEQFKAAYPASRRVGGDLARRAFVGALNDRCDRPALFARMLAAVEQQKRSEQWQTEKFIPLMTTWLNQERWNMVLPEVSPMGHSTKTASNQAALERFVAKRQGSSS